MQTLTRTVWYIIDSNNGQRLAHYRTQGGARIAQRLRNRHLGWLHRVERVLQEDQEWELCVNSEGDMELATYTVQEDHIEHIESIVDND
jgi:hypothetical protein